MRTGFLVSYKRTLLIVYPWLASFLIACHLAGVLGIALADFEVYASWILWPAIVAINKNMINGFQNLFNIFSEDDLKHSKNHPLLGRTNESTITQERIQETFTKYGYEKFIKKAKGLVFNPKQRYLIYFGFLLWIPILWIVYTFFWPTDFSFYDVSAPEIFVAAHYLSMVYIVVVLIPIISMAWLLYSMMASVHGIRTPELQISRTIPILNDPIGLGNDEFMSYTEFRSRIVLVGHFLYGITLRITGILVLLVMADYLRNWYLGFDWGVGRFIVGGILVLGTSIVVYISQLGLHSMLSNTKDEISTAIQKRKFKLDLEIQRNLDILSTKDTNSSYSSAHYNAVTRLDTLLQEIQSTSTWAIKSVNTVKVVSVSIVPLVSAILPLMIERLFF